MRISPLTRPDLCIENSDGDMKLKSCDNNDSTQLLTGFRDDGGRFELYVNDDSSRLISQDHDPKSHEKLQLIRARTARGDHTNYWQVYRPSGTSAPGPSPATPAPTPAQLCLLDLGLRDNDVIRDGQVFMSPDDNNIKLEQWNNGILAVRDGTNNVIWQSTQSRATGDYWTQLQGKQVLSDMLIAWNA